MRQISPGVYEQKRKLYTKGTALFKENMLTEGGHEYREWDPRKSKLCAALTKGMENHINTSSKVLYLGAAHGYTASYVADIAAHVFCIDFAPRVVRDLVFASEQRQNMTPILADARMPQTYYPYVTACDAVFQDIAQPNQVEIFLKNIMLFLKKGGAAYIAVKSRSIDSTADPKKIFRQVRAQLEHETKIIDSKPLEPFQRDHHIFLCKR